MNQIDNDITVLYLYFIVKWVNLSYRYGFWTVGLPSNQFFFATLRTQLNFQAKASGKDPLPPANPLWHQFCQEKFTPVQNPRRDIVYYEPLNHYPVSNKYHHCCHINDMGNKFLKTPNDVYVPTPQIPTFFNIAPGLRSVYSKFDHT